jgi:hypothetical protein
MQFLKLVVVVFGILFALGLIASVFLINYLKDFDKKEGPKISVIAVESLSDGSKIRLVRSEIKMFRGGSVLVIPLIPIPIGKKELVTDYYFELIDNRGASVWMGSVGIGLPSSASVVDLNIIPEVKWMGALDVQSDECYKLELDKSFSLKESEILKFIEKHQAKIVEVFRRPIGFVLRLEKFYPEFFKEGSQASFSFKDGYVSFITLPEMGLDRKDISFSYKLQSRDGLVDINAKPLFSKYSNLTDDQKSKLLAFYPGVLDYKDKYGISLREHILIANRLYKERFDWKKM